MRPWGSSNPGDFQLSILLFQPGVTASEFRVPLVFDDAVGVLDLRGERGNGAAVAGHRKRDGAFDVARLDAAADHNELDPNTADKLQVVGSLERRLSCHAALLFLFDFFKSPDLETEWAATDPR